jgi:hypothetical protein
LKSDRFGQMSRAGSNNKNVRSMLPPQFTSIALTLVSIAITELLLGDRPPVPQELLQVRHVHVGLRRAAVDVGSPAGAWDAFATCQRHKRRDLRSESSNDLPHPGARSSLTGRHLVRLDVQSPPRLAPLTPSSWFVL